MNSTTYRIEQDTSRPAQDPIMYAVLVLDAATREPLHDRSVNIQLNGAGSLDATRLETEAIETTHADGKAYFTWWPPSGQAPPSSSTDVAVRVEGDDCEVVVEPLT